MNTLEITGLEKKGAQEITTQLNQLLANFQGLYMNLRGFHWNIKGENFFILHEKFEALYRETNEQSDAIAERILTLESVPFHTFKEFMTHTEIEPAANVSNGDNAITHLINSYTILLDKERLLLQLASDHNDEGTAAMMSDLIGKQEKTKWMLKAYLS